MFVTQTREMSNDDHRDHRQRDVCPPPDAARRSETFPGFQRGGRPLPEPASVRHRRGRGGLDGRIRSLRLHPESGLRSQSPPGGGREPPLGRRPGGIRDDERCRLCRCPGPNVVALGRQAPPGGARWPSSAGEGSADSGNGGRIEECPGPIAEVEGGWHPRRHPGRATTSLVSQPEELPGPDAECVRGDPGLRLPRSVPGRARRMRPAGFLRECRRLDARPRAQFARPRRAQTNESRRAGQRTGSAGSRRVQAHRGGVRHLLTPAPASRRRDLARAVLQRKLHGAAPAPQPLCADGDRDPVLGPSPPLVRLASRPRP